MKSLCAFVILQLSNFVLFFCVLQILNCTWHSMFCCDIFKVLELRSDVFLVDIWYDVITSGTVVTSAAKHTTNRFCCVCTCITDTV